MNSEFNDMERMFRDGLQNYEVTPPAHVWNNIQKGKKKVGYWKIASTLLLLTIAGISTYYFTCKSQVENTNTNDVVTLNNTKTKSKSTSNSNLNQTITASAEETDNSNSEVALNNPSNSSTMIDGKTTNRIANSQVNTKAPNKKLKVKQAVSDNEEEITNQNNDQIKASSNLESFLVQMQTRKGVKFRYIIYPNLMRYVYSSKILRKDYVTRQAKTNKDKEDVKSLENRFTIEILGGPSYAFRRLSGEKAQLRNESERASLSTQTAVKVNYNLSQNWFIQSGLTFENRKEKISYDRTVEQQILVQTPKNVTIQHPILPPKVITIIDSTYSQQKVDYSFNQMNSYSSFSIPLSLGYNFNVNKLKYRVLIGSLFNIYTANTAQNLTMENDKLVLKSYNEGSHLKTSIYSSMGMVYPLNSSYNWISEVSYYTNLNNRLNSETGLVQKNYGFNFSTGLQFNLKK